MTFAALLCVTPSFAQENGTAGAVVSPTAQTEHHGWEYETISSGQFRDALKRVEGAALFDRPAFKSLKGELQIDDLHQPTWRATFQIPGFESCLIAYHDLKEFGAGFSYRCYAHFGKDVAAAKRAEGELVKAIDTVTGLLFERDTDKIQDDQNEFLNFIDDGEFILSDTAMSAKQASQHKLGLTWTVGRGEYALPTRELGLSLELFPRELWASQKNRLSSERAKFQAWTQEPTTKAMYRFDRHDAISVSHNDGITEEIASIRNGPHAAMPTAEVSSNAADGKTSMTIENGTQFTLYLFLSGPMNQRLQITPGASQTAELVPGNYEIAARVSSPSVIPFYGTQSYTASTRYSEHFYIATNPKIK